MQPLLTWLRGYTYHDSAEQMLGGPANFGSVLAGQGPTEQEGHPPRMFLLPPHRTASHIDG
jgi:hypothetical protein